MPADYFERFIAEAVEGYSRDTVAAGRWKEDVAAANSRAELDRFLPLGLNTPGHELCLIESDDGKDVVGTIWFGEMTRQDRLVAYVFDLRTYPQFQRQGHAASALAEVERRARDRGLAAIALHVFAHNLPALALYKKLGFAAADGFMVKAL
jgi:ribosomal protein S18 acetylase RimI-like enzyme